MSKYLEQLFFDGTATKEDEIKAGEVSCKYKISTITFEAQQKIDEAMSNLDEKSTALQASHTYIMEVLCHTILEYNNINFKTYEERKEYFNTKSATLINSLGKIQGKFENEVRALIDGDSIDKTFSKAPLILDESKPA